MTNLQMNLSGSSSASAPSSFSFSAHGVLSSLRGIRMIQPASVTGVIRAVTVLLAAFGLAAGIAKADPVTFPPLTTPGPGATVDSCSGCLFDVEGTPAAATGQAIVSWSFVAVNTNPVTPVIFNSAGVVVGVGTTITPTGTGLQTNLFGRTQGITVIAPGDTVGFFYPGKGSIAVTVGSGVPVVEEGGFGGLQAGTTQINTSSSVGNRTYSVSYTSNQVQLNPSPAAPGPGAISDTCQNCLFEYDPVTSQYNGTTLLTVDYFGLNLDPVIPVIFNSSGEVIGFGAEAEPTSTGFVDFAYIPQGGTSAMLATGDYLGWYDPDGSPIAFTLTGGQGATFAAFPSFSLGIDDATTTALPGRDYSIEFVTSDVAPVPEPSYTPIVALCLGSLLFFRSSVLSNRGQKC